MRPERTKSRAPVAWAAAALLLLAGLAGAQTLEESTVESEAQERRDQLDEIVVTGARTRAQLLRQAGIATENFYTRLNDVLNNDEFRVTCRTERSAGTAIARRVCRAGFQERLLERMAFSQLDGLMYEDDFLMTGATFDPSGELRVMQARFSDAIVDAVNTDPELNRAAHELIELRRAVLEYERRR